jgi:hypothetical protein
MPQPIRRALFAALVATALAGPVAADDTAAANRLFVAAVQAWTAAEALNGSDPATLETRLRLLREVVGNLRRIVADHAGADLAVRLVIGETVGPLSLPGAEAALAAGELALERALCPATPTRACVFAEALETARGIEDAGRRAAVLGAIAAAQGSPELFAEALATAWEIEDAHSRARALAAIARHLPE